VIKFVSDLNISRWFSPGPLVSSTNTIYRHNITAILLKVMLNTINHKLILIKQKIPHCRIRKRQIQYDHTRIHGHVLKGGVESWSGVLETPSWSGVLKTPRWSVTYDFSVDVFCKLGIDK